MSKFGERDWGTRVRMHNPPGDGLLNEYGLLLGRHPTEGGRVVVLSEKRYYPTDDGLRVCDEEYVGGNSVATINDYGGSVDLVLPEKVIQVKIMLPSNHGLNRQEVESLLLRFQIAADTFGFDRQRKSDEK